MTAAARVIPMNPQTPPTPASEFLRQVRNDGNWVPVPAPDVQKIVDAFIRTGAEFTEEMARLDLIQWADRKNIAAVRYYQKRWGWGFKRTYNFLCGCGLKGNTEGTTGEQAGNNRGTSGEQYNQTHTQTTDSERVRETRGELPAGVTLSGEGTYRLVPIATDEEGKGQFSVEAVLFVAKRLHGVTEEYDMPLRAWIETHEGKLPRPHDVRQLVRYSDAYGIEQVTRGIRQMGDRGVFKMDHLKAYMSSTGGVA